MLELLFCLSSFGVLCLVFSVSLDFLSPVSCMANVLVSLDCLSAVSCMANVVCVSGLS